MKKFSRLTAGLVAAVYLLGPERAWSTIVVHGQLSFSGVSVSSLNGDNPSWSSSTAYAQAGFDSHFASGATANTSASGDFATAMGQGNANTATASSDAFASIGSVDGFDTGSGQGSLSGVFRATSTGWFTFSVMLNGLLSATSDMQGTAGMVENVFTLSVDGTPLLFYDKFIIVGPNETKSDILSSYLLSDSIYLTANTDYNLHLESDSEVYAFNEVTAIPESNRCGLIVALFGFVLIARDTMRRRKFKVPAKAAALFIAGIQLCVTPFARATYIGADPPDVCQTCGYAGVRLAGGRIQVSITEGNLSESYPVITLPGGAGPAFQFSLKYNSYNADGSRAMVDCGVGAGWTHSFNVFLFSQRGSLFRMGPDGRVTLFRQGPGNTYSADGGYFETLTDQGSSVFTITNKHRSWWVFDSVPNTPFLVGGPVYRLTRMGDANNNIISLSYSNGLLTKITDNFGHALWLGYTNASKLATITDPLGRTTSLYYDTKFRTPIRIVDPAGNTVRYTYNSLYQITRKMDRDGRTYLYLYKKQMPWAVLDSSGKPWFAQSNPTYWAVDRTALAFALRRIYTSSTVTTSDGNGNLWRYQYDTNGYITRVTEPNGAITSYTYNPQTRQLASVTTPNGATTVYQYDSLGNRTRVTDPLGNVTTYTYDPVFNLVTSASNSIGHVTTYQYDSRGNKTNQTDALGQTTRWTYDSNGNLLAETDTLGRTITYSYDLLGNRTNVTDASGNITTYTYDAVGNRTSITDALGRTTRFQYDALDRVIGETNALGGISRYTYDPQNHQTSVTDPIGHTTTYQYDSRGRLLKTTDALGSTVRYGYDGNDNLITETNALGNVTRTTYDSVNRVIATTNALGGVTRYTYDASGNETSVTDANGNTTRYGYDSLNRLVTITNALGGVTRYDYALPSDPPCCSPTVGSSLITRSEDANGHIIYYHYDALDRRVQEIRKNSDTNDSVNPGDAATTTFYDAVGNVIAETDPAGHTTTYFYDALDRQTNSVNAAGDVTRTVYDTVGNVISVTDPNTNTVTYAYDALNRLTALTDPLGGIVTNSYDPAGNLTARTDGEGHTTTYFYDSLNRRTNEVDALGQSTYTSYDANGNILSTTDPLGRTTTYSYDGLDRRTQQSDPLSGVTVTAYDAVGNVVTNTDAKGTPTVYTYDALNRRITELYLDSPRAITNTYDAVGNLTSVTDQDGRVITYAYNALDFRTNKTETLGSITNQMIYDSAGKLIYADRDGWIVTYSYDGADRVTNTTQNGYVTSYTYDITGRTKTTTYPSGLAITESYDGRHRLTKIHDGTLAPPIATYTYDSADRAINRTYRNGTVTTYSYDPESRVTNITHNAGVPLIAGFSYSYDQNGNKRYEMKLHLLSDSEAYAYDALDRLTNYDVGTLSSDVVPAPVLRKTWTLDAVGNWTIVTSNGVPELRAYDPNNELTNIAGQPLFYDAAGSLTQDVAYAYAYDENHQLTQVRRLSDSKVVGQYFYDALGRRVGRIASAGSMSVTNIFIYDGDRLIEERDGDGTLAATYVYGNYVDEVLTMNRAGQTYYYHQNALWSPHALTDSSGAVVERYTYDVYGEPVVLDAGFNAEPPNSWGTPHSAVGNPWLFTGREFDQETGLYFHRARYFDPTKGRFLQRDPIGYGDDLNLYEYLHSAPTSGTDPTGLADAKDNDAQKKKAIEAGKQLADKFFEDLKSKDINLLQDVDNSKLIQAAAQYAEVRDYIREKMIKEIYPKLGSFPKPTVARKRCEDLMNGIKDALEAAKNKDAARYSWKAVKDEAEKILKAIRDAANPPGAAKGPGKGGAPSGTLKGPGLCQLKEDAVANSYIVWRKDEKNKDGTRDIGIKITGAKDADGLINGWRQVVVTWKKDLGSPVESKTIWVFFKDGDSVNEKTGKPVYRYVGSGNFPFIRSAGVVSSPGAAKDPGNGAEGAGSSKGPAQGVDSAGSSKGL